MSAFLTQAADDAVEVAATWAVRLAEDELTVEQQAAFDAWLDADPRHGELLEEIIGAWRSVDHYASTEPLTAMREQALASARRTLRRDHRRFASRELVSGLIAAMLLLVVGGGLLWMHWTPQIYETDVGERRVVALKDGSKVSLDADTVVKVLYADGKRRLWLDRGRAKFDVAKNPLRPFSVAAADKIVVATGTAFSVELVNAQVRVALYEGHVAILKRDAQNTDASHETPVEVGAVAADRLLVPGRELIMPERSAARLSTQVAAVETADPERSLSWETGLMVFNDEPLNVVVERMNRYAEKPLSVGDPATGRLRISGVFPASDTNSLVQGLALGFGVQARASSDGTVLFADVRTRPG